MNMMLSGTEVVSPQAEFPGELPRLKAQLGAPLQPGGTATLAGVHCVASLRGFLDYYRRELLEPRELPAIYRAFTHASRNETRELIAFDRQLGMELPVDDFALASRRIGLAQLKRLRPLRDARFVQRFLAAVENGQAHGWHTLVFGLGLHVFSLPLRQGLVGYAQQTLAGFVHAIAPRLALTEAAGEDLVAATMATLPAAVEEILAENPTTRLRGALPLPL